MQGSEEQANPMIMLRIGGYTKKSANRVVVSKFLDSNEMKTINNRAQKPETAPDMG